MTVGNTSIGGSQGRFPETSLGLFSRLWNSGGQDRQDSLETLYRRYWKPIYCYVRVAWAKTNEEAKDLTQAFCLWLLEEEALARYRPELGSFRHYLKLLLNGFAANQHRALSRLKRGGGRKIVDLDGQEAALKDLLPDPGAESPELAFDRQWLRTVIEQAVARVKLRFHSDGRAQQFRVYELVEIDPGGPPLSHAEVAARLGLREIDVRHFLFAVRDAVRAEVRVELSQTTLNVQELEREWNEFFTA